MTYLETDMLVSQPYLELLSSILVLLGPLCVVFLHDLGRLDDAPDLLDDERRHAHFLADQAVIPVVAVVGVPGHGAPSVAHDAEVEL